MNWGTYKCKTFIKLQLLFEQHEFEQYRSTFMGIFFNSNIIVLHNL